MSQNLQMMTCVKTFKNISCVDVRYKWTFGLTLKSVFVFADADQYELQATSSPMKSPHRYSPSVFPQQVPHTLATAPAVFLARCHLKSHIKLKS